MDEVRTLRSRERARNASAAFRGGAIAVLSRARCRLRSSNSCRSPRSKHLPQREAFFQRRRLFLSPFPPRWYSERSRAFSERRNVVPTEDSLSRSRPRRVMTPRHPETIHALCGSMALCLRLRRFKKQQFWNGNSILRKLYPR